MDDSIVFYHCINMVRNACIEKVKRNKKTGNRHPTLKKVIAYLVVKINFPLVKQFLQAPDLTFWQR
jgi:hypothetical protein